MQGSTRFSAGLSIICQKDWRSRFRIPHLPKVGLIKTARYLLPYLGRQPVELVLFLTGLHYFCQLFCQLWIHLLQRRKIGLGISLTTHFGVKDTPEWHEDKAHLGLILRPVSVWRGAHFFTRFGK